MVVLRQRRTGRSEVIRTKFRGDRRPTQRAGIEVKTDQCVELALGQRHARQRPRYVRLELGEVVTERLVALFAGPSYVRHYARRNVAEVGVSIALRWHSHAIVVHDVTPASVATLAALECLDDRSAKRGCSLCHGLDSVIEMILQEILPLGSVAHCVPYLAPFDAGKHFAAFVFVARLAIRTLASHCARVACRSVTTIEPENSTTTRLYITYSPRAGYLRR